MGTSNGIGHGDGDASAHALDVGEALGAGTLIKTWAMRGTLHAMVPEHALSAAVNRLAEAIDARGLGLRVG